MENSPPGIQTMPCRGWVEAGEELGAVGRNSPTEAALTEVCGKAATWCSECRCVRTDTPVRAAVMIMAATTHRPSGPDCVDSLVRFGGASRSALVTHSPEEQGDRSYLAGRGAATVKNNGRHHSSGPTLVSSAKASQCLGCGTRLPYCSLLARLTVLSRLCVE